MIMVQLRVQLNTQDEYLTFFENPKIQPDFAKMAILAFFAIRWDRYENFWQKIDESGSNEGLIEYIGQIPCILLRS